MSASRVATSMPQPPLPVMILPRGHHGEARGASDRRRVDPWRKMACAEEAESSAATGGWMRFCSPAPGSRGWRVKSIICHRDGRAMVVRLQLVERFECLCITCAMVDLSTTLPRSVRSPHAAMVHSRLGAIQCERECGTSSSSATLRPTLRSVGRRHPSRAARRSSVRKSSILSYLPMDVGSARRYAVPVHVVGLTPRCTRECSKGDLKVAPSVGASSVLARAIRLWWCCLSAARLPSHHEGGAHRRVDGARGRRGRSAAEWVQILELGGTSREVDPTADGSMRHTGR